MVKIEDLANLLDVKLSVILHDINGMIYNNYNKSGNPISDCLICINSNSNYDKVTEDNSISINKKFNNSNVKLSLIPSGNIKKSKTQLKKDDEEVKKLKETYEEQIIDLTITRIMKGRIGKDTKHNELIAEICKHIELFVPKVDQIKNRIENLINRNVIQRKHEFSDMYEYVS